MKKLLCVLLLTVLFCSSSFSQEKNADTLLHTIVKAIQNNDSVSFAKLFMNYQQFNSLMTEEALKTTDSTRKAILLRGVSNYSEAQFQEDITSILESRFGRFMNRIRSKGIDPAKLNFVSCQYRVEIPKGFDDQQEFNGTIFVKDDKEDYRIPFISATWLVTQEVWMGVSLQDILKKDEKEVIEDSVVVESVIVKKIEEVEPPPPPPPKKKTTTKSPQRKNND